MSEMENTADHLIVIGRGRLIADCGISDFIAGSEHQAVLVRTTQPGALTAAIASAGGTTSTATSTAGAVSEAVIEVRGLTEDQVADLAFAHGIRLHHLSTSKVSLEQAFMELTADSVDYQANQPGRPTAFNGTEA